MPSRRQQCNLRVLVKNRRPSAREKGFALGSRGRLRKGSTFQQRMEIHTRCHFDGRVPSTKDTCGVWTLQRALFPFNPQERSLPQPNYRCFIFLKKLENAFFLRLSHVRRV